MRKVKQAVTMILVIVIAVAFMPFINDAGFAQAASKPAKVKFIVKKCTITNQMVDLKWKKAKGAKKYQVYMKIGKGKWKKKKTVKAKTRTLKINGLKWNKTYYFKVRAVKGKKKGKFSKVLRAKVGKKRVLANFMTDGECEEIAQQMIDDSNGVFGMCEVSVRSNLVTYESYLASPYDSVDSGKLAELLEPEFNTQAKKKEISNLIKKLQDKVGIVGIQFSYKFYKSDGTYIYGITYKAL